MKGRTEVVLEDLSVSVCLVYTSATLSSPSVPSLYKAVYSISPVVGTMNDRPKDRSQAPYTLNTHMSAVKLSNSTHRRVMKQVQAIFPWFLVSCSCNVGRALRVMG